MKNKTLRVAYFPCSYYEIDGIASTSRHFEAFAKRRKFPFLMVHAGPRNDDSTGDSITHVELRRSPAKFPLDRAHEFDLLFLRHIYKVERLVREFQPDLVQITGPSDLGILGALVAHRLDIPLAASWQANLHQYARSRAAASISFIPKAVATKLLDAVERLSFRATARFYKIPRLLFAPNQEIIRILETTTGKPCFLMSHAVDTTVFNPAFRRRMGGPFRIGYVGRLTAEKNVPWLVQLEQGLRARGHRNFRMVLIGQGRLEKWLRNNLQQAEFTGVLQNTELSRAFADLDVLAFPSETDTFGLVVLEALASGVPAVVTGRGGPKSVVQHGSTGYIAENFDEFVNYVEILFTRPDLLERMRAAARLQAETTSWDLIFESMYEKYEKYLCSAVGVNENLSDSTVLERSVYTDAGLYGSRPK